MGTETRAMPRMKSFMFFAFFCMSIPSIVPSWHDHGGEDRNDTGEQESTKNQCMQLPLCASLWLRPHCKLL